MDISTSYFIKIFSYRERPDVDSQRIKKCTFQFGFQGWKSRKQRKVNYKTSKNDFIMMPFILIWLKIKTNLIKLVLNTFISIKGPIFLQNCPILSLSEPDQLIQVIKTGIRRIWTPFDSPRFTHRNLTCFRSSVSHFSAISLSGNRGCTFWCE